MSNPADRVLILGGTGNYGRSITRSLIGRGANIRLLTRNVERARDLFGDDVDIVSGNIEDACSIERSFKNVDRIVCAISAFTIAQIRRYASIEQDAVVAAFELARRVGIRRIVYLSVFEVNREFAKSQRVPFAEVKARVEDYISKSNLNWTVLGAPPSMDIFFRMVHGTNMMVPGGGPKGLPTVSPVDVGEIAAQAVMRDDLSGRRIQMVAPEAYSFPEAADRISKAWGRSITFRRIPMVFPRIGLHVTGLLAPFSDRLLYVHRLLGFVNLLNNFPQEYIEKVPIIHKYLLSLFSYSPSSLEIEAKRRMPDLVKQS